MNQQVDSQQLIGATAAALRVLCNALVVQPGVDRDVLLGVLHAARQGATGLPLIAFFLDQMFEGARDGPPRAPSP